jgi:YVTN family beta-propeller protein
MVRRDWIRYLLPFLLLLPLAAAAADSQPGAGAGDQELPALSRAIWYVSPAGSDVTGDGSLANPFATIQHALNLAAGGDMVRALAGDYHENIVMKSGVDVRGEGAGATAIIGEPIVQGTVSFQNVQDCALDGFRLTAAYHVGGTDRAVVFGTGLGGTCALRHCLVVGVQYGCYIWSNSPQIENNTFVGTDGGEQGVYIDDYADTPLIRNNIIVGYFYAGIHVIAGDVHPVIECNDVWNNSTNYQGWPDQTGLNGNISANPLFVDPDAGDYTLQPGSPCNEIHSPCGYMGGFGPASGEYGLVACSTSDSYARFDLASYMVEPSLSLLPEGNYPYDATMNPAGTEIWIPGASGDGLVVVDRASGVITHRITAGDYPISIAFSNGGDRALMACRDSETIEVIDTATYTVTYSLPVPTTYLGAGNIALDPISGKFYCVDWYGDDFYEIAPDGSAVLNVVTDLGSSLWQLVVAPDGQYVYVTDRGTDQVRVVDRATLAQVNTFPVGDDPWGIDITADGSILVVVCEDSHDAYIINLYTGGVIPVALGAGAYPRDVDILDSEHLAFVAGGQSATGGSPVFVIDLATSSLLTSFPATCTNTNVIAVQPQMHQILSGVATATPRPLLRLAAHPNPFNPVTRIEFSLVQDATIDLAVYDLQGRRVRTLSHERRPEGVHTVTWDGRDGAGRAVSSGVYLVRLITDRGESMGLKVALLK